ncbi:hypothetical protein Drose_35030 [Dactylosporangium roseum]|uniref:Uncharacterized protein n=1 Tax=Dactylosporangium roseum TaxID=47989 RepID=A0ABY5Z3K4_9ACTN|nr:hypothetical protein [Dactylosporangium roseum]UWZ36214.1 hypothetical protein Drose_35030 [Dactylosporangium roseum]
MPVSRKRKKKAQSGSRSSRQPVVSPRGGSAGAGVFGELFEHRHKLAEHRTALAGDAAGALIDALIASAPGRSDDDLEDDLCIRYGAAMASFEGGSVEGIVNPEDFVGALLSALDERFHKPAEAGADIAVLQRLLAVVAGVLPFPLSESASDLISAHLDAPTAKRVARGHAVTGSVLWARDVYGTRWAVVAPFTSVAGPDRWYLWDVDTCGYEVLTVHSGFHASAESAVAAWRESVGQVAAGGAVLTAVEDSETLDALLRGEVEGIRIGGEGEEQYAEFLRSRRLGGTARKAVRRMRGRAFVRLTATDAKAQFAKRLRQLDYHGGIIGEGDDAGPVGPDELAEELAESWSPRDHPTLYPFCSPHKVAVAVLHLRDFYQEDFAAELVALLPEWIRFLAEHTAMSAELTERCLAYASGELPFPGILDDRGRSNPMARVAE